MRELGVGDVCGSYELLEAIGTGGAAQVFRARHVHPGYAEYAFAVKVLRAEVSEHPDVVARFRREALVLSMLKHANIVQTYDAGVAGDDLYIAMEFVDGWDLHQVLAACDSRPLPLPVALHIAGELLKALSYAHALRDSGDKPLNVIHRDVKPSNVLLSYDGRVKLTDFGVATITGGDTPSFEEVVFGTKGYFAPEQLGGLPADHRADLFAVGVLLFEMLCGRPLFDADTTEELMRQNRRARVPRPHKLNRAISGDLERFMLKALARKPQKRFADADSMLHALTPALPHPAGMPLAMAAFLRTALAPPLRDNRRRREERRAARDAAEAPVAVCSSQAGMRQRLATGLHTVDVSIMPCASQAALVKRLGDPTPLRALLFDLATKDFSALHLLAAQEKRSVPIPLVALAKTLDTAAIHSADTLGAVDLLVMPVRAERLLLALQIATTPALRRSPTHGPDTVNLTGAVIRVLLISTDAELIAGLSSTLSDWGYTVDVSPTAAEAVQRAAYANYHGVIYESESSLGVDFILQLRQQPGMGLVPGVCLVHDADANARDSATVPTRCAVRRRDESPVVLVAALTQLRMASTLGRTFIRYPLDTTAQLHYSGHAVSAEVRDLSRGGALVRCANIPAVDTPVSLTLGSGEDALHIEGSIVRVDLPRSDPDDEGALLGIEFIQSDQPDIVRLISRIETLAATRR